MLKTKCIGGSQQSVANRSGPLLDNTRVANSDQERKGGARGRGLLKDETLGAEW